jgi:hypothetical protein
VQPWIGLLWGQLFAYSHPRNKPTPVSPLPPASSCLFVEITSSGAIVIAFATTPELTERTLLSQLIEEHLKQLA